MLDVTNPSSVSATAECQPALLPTCHLTNYQYADRPGCDAVLPSTVQPSVWAAQPTDYPWHCHTPALPNWPAQSTTWPFHSRTVRALLNRTQKWSSWWRPSGCQCQCWWRGTGWGWGEATPWHSLSSFVVISFHHHSSCAISEIVNL